VRSGDVTIDFVGEHLAGWTAGQYAQSPYHLAGVS
jgi:hypothetical protein